MSSLGENSALRRPVPDDVVDADDVAAALTLCQRVSELQQEHVLLVTLAGSMSPSKGTEIRACRLNPSS